jgi:dipeptidyl aminopeptidase/acylaminoacyl peptidase
VKSVSPRTLAVVTALSIAIGYLVVSVQMGSTEGAASLRGNGRSAHPIAPPFIIFRALAPREAYGRLAYMGLAPGAKPRLAPLSCVRMHYAGGRGLCATQETRDVDMLNVAYVFDRTLQRGPRVELDGIATRLRVAPDGRLGAITTYAEEETPEGERLATRTRIVNMRTAQVMTDLREFRIENLNLPPISGPIDFASVAFERDGDRFFATLSTGTERYLVAGSVSERRVSTIRTGVSSEALSPDGRRLAVKRLLPTRGYWQLAVIDLTTWQERDLQQGPRSVDDQVEWLDDGHVMYHDVDGESTALWVLPIDGINPPSVLIKDAYSGVVQR